MKLRTHVCALTCGFIVISSVAACVDDEVTTVEDDPIEMVGRLSALQGDTVPCPRNPWHYTYCQVPSGAQMQTLYNQVQLFAPAEACQDAKAAALDALSSGVYIALHEFPTGGIAWDRQAPPAQHQPENLFLAEYLFMPQHVSAGNLREVLYHEASHLLHYEDSEPAGEKMTSEEFATMCKSAEIGNIESSDQGGNDHSGEQWCDVRTWFYVDTGEIIATEVLYCY